MKPIILETQCPEETERLGLALAKVLQPGTVVALFGGLATGKTCLVRGMAAHFAPGQPTHSPTFTLVNEYGQAPILYHLDLYRLSGPDELADLGYEEIIDGQGICAIEWAERAGRMLPTTALRIRLEHAGGDRRRITIENPGTLGEHWLPPTA